MKTIALPEDLHKEIMKLRLQKESKNTAELIKELLFEYRQRKFLEHSKMFKDALKKKGISFKEFLKRAEKVREEVADELFPES